MTVFCVYFLRATGNQNYCLPEIEMLQVYRSAAFFLTCNLYWTVQ